MVAFTPPIPFVATRDMLVTWFHREFACNTHYADSEASECELWADRLLESGFVQDGGEFLGGLKDNPAVQDVIKGHLAEAWDDGYLDGYNSLTSDPPKNPYKDKT